MWLIDLRLRMDNNYRKNVCATTGQHSVFYSWESDFCKGFSCSSEYTCGHTCQDLLTDCVLVLSSGKNKAQNPGSAFLRIGWHSSLVTLGWYIGLESESRQKHSILFIALDSWNTHAHVFANSPPFWTFPFVSPTSFDWYLWSPCLILGEFHLS